MPERDLYIMLFSVHGLLRGEKLELGRDSDTGGQITYVLELARALSARPDVSQVDLVTRQIFDPKVDDGYAAPLEPIAPGASIVRIPCGPRRYIRKELLWPHLDGFVDNVMKYLRSAGKVPHLVHGHYADAGYVVSQLSGLLDVPMAFTGHSLGRVKRERLLEQGLTKEAIEKRYHIDRRIEAEEVALDHAAFVIASTRQEVREQYAQYENYEPRRMLVVPPGVDLTRFAPPRGRWGQRSPVIKKLEPFLSDPRKPMILALSRPDPRKNIATLIHAFGAHPRLREQANLVVVAGNREDVAELDPGPRDVLTELLLLVDRYDLYGHVALPKQHSAEEVPEFYRLAARTKGLFVNPALTEPFGLTLLEAAASGLPVVATDDGGPQDILEACRNGVLIDPTDAEALGEALEQGLADRKRWRSWSRSGVTLSRKHFGWKGHAEKYLRAVRTAINRPAGPARQAFGERSRLITAERLLVCDVDDTLTGDRQALRELIHRLGQAGERVALAIATGRSLELTREVLAEWDVPPPQVVITAVGCALHYGPGLVEDRGWQRHIRYRWRPNALREAMSHLPGLELQGPEGQAELKISYDVDPDRKLEIPEIRRHLRAAGLHANIIYSHGAYLDVIPLRASKGKALRYFCMHWEIPLERCLCAGDSGNDEDMLTGNTLAVVVGNHDPGLEKLRGRQNVYFASAHHARGVLEGIDHYDFLGEIRNPETEAAADAVHPGS